MSNSTEIPDAVIGTAEPSSSAILVLLSVVTVGMFGLLVQYLVGTTSQLSVILSH